MTMSLRCSVLLLALVCVTGIVAAESRAKDSCMVHWMVRAGVSHTKSKRAEQRLLLVGSTAAEISQTGTNIVSFLLQTTPADSNKLRSCFAGSSKTCTKFSPCKHGGKCMPSLSKKEHVCICPLDYSGVFCKIPHPAPLRDLRVLQKTVKELTVAFKASNVKNIKKLTDGFKALKKTQIQRGKLWKCHFPFVARKHYTWYATNTGMDNGRLRSVKFVKKQEHTTLRLLYSSNIREMSAQAVGRWSIKIDGHDCTRPSKIDITAHHSRVNNIHVPAVLLGTCQATSRGRIGKGQHTISVHIKSSDGYSGWASTSFMEIKEICTDRQ